MKKTFSIGSELILTFVLTLATVSQLSGTFEGRLMIGIAAAVMLAYSAYKLKTKWEDKVLRFRSFALIACAVICFFFCGKGSSDERDFRRYESRREQFLSEMRQGYLDMKKQEQEMDGYRLIAQAKMYEKDEYYNEAREYAQKAANEGVSDAHIMLANFAILGIGGPVSATEAVSHLIKAMKRDFFTPREKAMQYLSGTMGLRDSLEMEECKRQQAVVFKIRERTIEIYKKFGIREALKVVRKNEKELSSLAVAGFAPAAELLFLDAYYGESADAVKLKLYSEMLYHAAYLSSVPEVRADLLNAYRGKDYYENGAFEKSENDNNFLPFLFPDETGVVCDYGSLSLDELAEWYSLMSAQYRWFRCLYSSPDYRMEYAISEPAADYNRLYSTSIKRLNEVSREVRKRMPEPGSLSHIHAKQ